MAQQRPCYQVSTFGGAAASFAVDGLLTTESCTQMTLAQPWWAVDIGQQAIVKVVYVVNDGNVYYGETYI